jgi:DNA-binding LacI/PurR family transcriptional regulator
MRDVAKAAGVSQGTVSRVLSKAYTTIPISEDTYKRVMEAVEQLGYYPNQAARTLRTQRTHLIAIMIADISNPFYHSLVRTVQDIVRVYDYDVMIANTDHNYEDEKRFCAAVMRRAVDGVIMVPFHLTDHEIDQVIKRTRTSVAVLGNHTDHPLVDSVYGDDQKATYDAIRWLIQDKHHQRIGFLGVPDNFPPGLRRKQAYLDALHHHGLAVNPDYMVEGEFTAESGYNAMQTLLNLPTPPSAIFACNDRIAMGAIAAAQDLGKRIPQDIAVIGFDDIPEAILIRPHLTTIAQHPATFGTQLAEALLDRLERGYNGERRVFRMDCTLVERDST